MNVISGFGKFLQEQVARFCMRVAALYLFRDYKINPSFTEFTALDGQEFMK
jgi:hypothetical protein